MVLMNLSYMAEFFFMKLSSEMLERRSFSYALRFLKNLSKDVPVLNNGFNHYTACFKIRVPTSTTYTKIYEGFFIRVV